MSQLSATARQEYYLELGNALPPPVTDTRERRDTRMRTAIEAFNALCPGNAFEGRLAVQIVLCGAHSAECLREAGLNDDDFAKKKSCRAQATSLEREARAAVRILRQEQKQRLILEAVSAAAPAKPSPALAAPPSMEPQPAPAPAPAPEALAQAEAFAQRYVLAAAQIRQDGGITPRTRALFHDVTFPADPAVLDALVRGASDVLRALDEISEQLQAEAA